VSRQTTAHIPATSTSAPMLSVIGLRKREIARVSQSVVTGLYGLV